MAKLIYFNIEEDVVKFKAEELSVSSILEFYNHTNNIKTENLNFDIDIPPNIKNHTDENVWISYSNTLRTLRTEIGILNVVYEIPEKDLLHLVPCSAKMTVEVEMLTTQLMALLYSTEDDGILGLLWERARQDILKLEENYEI